MLERLVEGGSLPALERSLQFASARHRLILNNIANLETPGFRPSDVSPEGFQGQLRDALDARQLAISQGLGDRGLRAEDGGLALPEGGQVTIGRDGLGLAPEPLGESILYHDGNDRNLERILQSLTENLIAFRFASTMIRRQFASIDAAIRERP